MELEEKRVGELPHVVEAPLGARFGLPGAPRLAQRGPEAAGEGQEDHRRGGDAEAVAPHELARAIPARAAPREDGPSLEVPRDVLRQGLRRKVSELGLLAHRLHDDGVDVSRDVSRRGDRARFVRVLLADEAEQLRRLGILNVVGPAPGHQLVEDDAEGIDVAGRRHGLTADLLRAGVVGRQHPVERRGFRTGPRRPTGIQHLRDAEIEKLRLARPA